jgi:hypothetical protein
MSKRIVCGVLCGLLAVAIGCGVKKPTPPDSCSSVPYQVLVKDGVRYLHVPLPDGNIVIINIDTLPPPPPAPPAPPPAPAADRLQIVPPGPAPLRVARPAPSWIRCVHARIRAVSRCAAGSHG